MKIVKEGPLYLLDDRWWSPTDNEFLNNRMLDRVRASVCYPFAKPTNSIDDRIMDILDRDMVLIDVGATTGEYTIGASLMVKEVHSIEANPRKADCLRKNMQLHACNNVNVYNYAMSNVEGEIEIYDDDDRIFGGSVYTDGNPDQTFTVTAKTLDSFVDENDIKSNVLKLTVNGHEPEILLGAQKTLKQLKYIVIQSARYEEIIPYLEGFGYCLIKEIESCNHDLLQKTTKILLFERNYI